MKRLKTGLLLVAGLSIGILGCGKSTNSTTSAQPSLSPADRAKRDEMNRKAQIGAMSDQINRSPVSPEQKQRLLQQVRSQAGK